MAKSGWHIIVDSNNMLAIHAHSHEELSHNGMKTGGIYGTLRKAQTMLLQDLGDYDIRSMIYASDAGRPKFRTRLCPEYKTGRAKNPTAEKDDFHKHYVRQCRMAPAFLNALGLDTVFVDGWEADDVIAWLVTRVHPDKKFIIVSGDKDFVQLAHSKRVHIYRPSQDEIIQRCPSGYLLRRCLVGDTSDTIPGVKGVGEGRAIEILHNAKEAKGKALYTTPDELYEGYDGKWMDTYLSKFDSERIVRRNWQIMNLRISARKLDSAEKKVTYARGKLSSGEFRSQCRELSFTSLLNSGEAFVRPFKDLAEKAEHLNVPS